MFNNKIFRAGQEARRQGRRWGAQKVLEIVDKKIYYAAIVLIFLALSAWAFGEYQTRLDYKAKLEAVKAARDRAETASEALRAEIQDANTIITFLRLRPPTAHYKTLVKEVPVECESCIGKFMLPYSWENELIRFETDDIFTLEPKAELKPEFEKRVIQPWRDALDECERSLKPSMSSPLRWRHEIAARAGIGLFGYEGEVAYTPFEFGGGRFTASPVAWIAAGARPEVEFTGAVGIQIEIGR